MGTNLAPTTLSSTSTSARFHQTIRVISISFTPVVVIMSLSPFSVYICFVSVPPPRFNYSRVAHGESKSGRFLFRLRTFGCMAGEAATNA